MGFEKPKQVTEAMLRKDKPALRNMQKQAVISGNANRAERKENKETTVLEASLHEAQLDANAEAIAHYEQALREIRGEQ